MGRASGQSARLNSASREEPGATAYANHLLESLGVNARVELPYEHPAVAWARSGLMDLTGHANGPPLMCPIPLAACADGALAALTALAPAGSLDGSHGSQLLAERAAITGHSRRGAISPGGCHLLECADGWLAVNLTREEDWAMLPAWLEADLAATWETLAQALRQRSAGDLVLRAHEIGLAVALSSFPNKRETNEAQPDSRLRGSEIKRTRPLVIDLSSLWAGPLCSRLLQRCGAEVIKVESLQRPDGARHGHVAFFDLLNAGKQCVALDFTTPHGRDQLRSLLLKADIVIEGTRPRALRQLGIRAEAMIEQNPKLTWISITGYGRSEAQENWIAYGDDAGVAAGLSEVMFEAAGERVFVGDAIADPLTGLHAALAAYASLLKGGGRLVALSLVEVVRQCATFDLPLSTEVLRRRYQTWTAMARGG